MKPLHRRTFLRGAAGAALSLPLLESMMGGRSRVRADDLTDGFVDGRIKRFVVVFMPNGVHGPSFFPTDGGSFAGTSLAPIEAFRDRTLVLDGLKMQCAVESVGEKHQSGMGGLLTGTRLLDTREFGGGDGSRAGWANGISIDQRIAARLRGTTRYKSLELGVRTHRIGSEVRSRMSYRGPSDPIGPIDDPRQVFDTLFSDLDTSDVAGERLRLRRRRIVDAVQDQFVRVQSRVGVADRARLERHLSFIDEIETRIGAAMAVCAPGERPPAFENADSVVPATGRAHMDLMVAAFACDLTRVASLQYDTASCAYSFPWLGDTDEGHPLGHAMALPNEPAVIPSDPVKTEATRKWNNRVAWHLGEVAYLLSRLEETPDGEGTLLDSTAVLFTSELSNAHHVVYRMPFVLCGNAGGAFRSGVVRYATSQSEMPAHNRLLIALQRGYGIDADVFGEEQYCGGGALDRVLV